MNNQYYIIMQSEIHPDEVSGADYALLLSANVGVLWEPPVMKIRIPVLDPHTTALVIVVMQGYGFKVSDVVKR